MKVKLQPPSGTELSPFSPVQPPAAITQVMLLANPMKVSVGQSTWGPLPPPDENTEDLLRHSLLGSPGVTCSSNPSYPRLRD